MAQRIASNRGPEPADITHQDAESYEGIPGAKRHVLGVLGELAVADWYGLTLNSGSDLDPGYDFAVSYDGERATIDVKTTTYADDALRVGTESLTADYYLLAVVEDTTSTTVELIGIATQADLRAAETVDAPHSGDTQYSIPQADLDDLPARDEIVPL